jgi:hypothetical protein
MSGIDIDVRPLDEAGTESTTTVVTLLDINVAGRAWCHVPTSEL